MTAARSTRLVLSAVGVLVAVGLTAASAASQANRLAALEATVELVTAGPGKLAIAPAQNADSATCEVDAQVYEGDGLRAACIHQFDEGTTVTLTATPNPGHSFMGWSDFKCARKSTTCTMTLAPGPRYVAARFSPVTLTLLRGKDDVGANRFGTVTVTPTRSGCSFEFGTTSPCDYAAGTLVTLRRQRAAPGFFWIGACDRNRGGRLDAAECTLRLRSNEVIGAGFATVKEIPPPLGSGVEVRLAGKGQGKVSGGVINGSKALTCQGVRCLITGLTRYDYIRLQVKTTGKNRFDRWSDGSHATNRVIGLMATNRLWAKFDKKR